MEYIVVGKEFLDYVSKKTGKNIKGYTLHMTHEKQGCLGLATLSEFVSEEIGQDIAVNDTVELLYNKYGKVFKIVVL